MPEKQNKVSSTREASEKATQTYAALGVGFVCIVIGLPLWWKTTEVYRVQLPYSEISSLANSHVRYNVDFATIVLDKTHSNTDLALFGGKLKTEFESVEKPNEGLSPVYRGQVRQSTEHEAEAYEIAPNIQDLDDKMSSKSDSECGKYHLYLLPEDGHIKIDKPYIGRGRSVFLMSRPDLDTVIRSISAVIREVLVNEAAIAKAFYTAKGAVLNKADKDSMRSLRLYPGYEVTFTLLNPQPEVLQAEWDIKGAIKEYMSPLLKAFSPYAEVNVKSQYLHYTGLGVGPTKDQASGEYQLTQENLPHIINPIEAHLSSHVSINPNLNFVLYMTPRSHYPLQIYDSTGAPSSSNSFLSPRWGGVMVYNTPTPENVSLPAPVQVDMRTVMEVFLYQLRLLMGVNPQIGSLDIDIAPPGKSIVTKWELDQWLRLRTLENIATSVSTLRSLAQLLEEISNIVINDEIGQQVERAVSSLQTAQMYLKQAKLKDAFLFGRQALLSSETAFFDPSLLELLYFPEDQKFAIYIPLFLPISIPVIMSVMQAVKRLRNKVKIKEE